MKKSIIAFLLLMVFIVALAATFNSTTGGGSWSSTGTWQGGIVPADNGSHTVNIIGDVAAPTSLQGFTALSLSNGKFFTSGTSSINQNLTLNAITNFNVVNGNIVVYGDLTLTNNTTLTITSGSLTVTGILSITNGSSIIQNSSGSISAGSLTTGGSGGSLTMNSGSLTVTNALSITSASTITLASGVSTTAGSLSISDNSNAILNNNGTTTISGNVTQGGVLNNIGSLQVNGNLNSSGSSSSVTTNGGSLNITGNVSLPASGTLKVNPGGQTLIFGSTTVYSNENLIVGTNVAPPPYADLAIKGDLVAQTSGDLTINQNGKFAVFGNMTASGGATKFIVNNGGQAYVHGNINFTGGGDEITNNNSTSPFGLYVNGTVTNSGGGSITTSNSADRSTMESTNVPFTNWANAMFALLPVKLLYFKVINVEDKCVTLNWMTESEIHFQEFIIEKSTGGKEFFKIGSVRAQGGVDLQHLYSFVDRQPFTGRAYYRLKALDLDGRFEYFNIVKAEFSGAKQLVVYPNPTNGSFISLSLNFLPLEKDLIKITDNTGLIVSTLQPFTFDNKLNFAKDLSPGLYFLHYIGEESHTIRFVVR